MVFRKISEDIKNRALWLLDHDYIPEDVCDILGVSSRSLRRWESNVEVYGSVIPPPLPNRGRPRVLHADMTHDLVTLMEEAPEMYLDEIQDWLAVAHECNLPKSTLFDNLRDCGITYKKLQKAAAERDEEARTEWKSEVHNHWVASQILVADETSKDDRTLFRRYGHSVAGQRATTSALFTRGDRYSVIAAMGLEGYIATRVVMGSVDSDEFCDFILNEVACNIPPFHQAPSKLIVSQQLPKMNPYPNDRSILILDNCAIHKCAALREIFEAQSALMFISSARY